VDNFTNGWDMQQMSSWRPIGYGRLDDMHKEDTRDLWLNQSRTPLTAWEKALLRPSRSSNRVLFLTRGGFCHAAAFVALNSGRGLWAPWEGKSAEVFRRCLSLGVCRPLTNSSA
jgi:hypothetical protein